MPTAQPIKTSRPCVFIPKGVLLVGFQVPEKHRPVLTSIFAGFYFLFFSTMEASHSEFVRLYWNHANISGIQIVGIPVEELLFAFSLGGMWSAFYEHQHWLRLKIY